MRAPNATIALLMSVVGLLYSQSDKNDIDSQGVMQETKSGSAKTSAIGKNTATVRISLNEELRKQIASALADPEQPKTVQVKLEGVAPPSTGLHEQTTLKVFINKPDASGKVSEKDPHFVGALEFQPTTDRKPQSFLLDAGPALAELARTKQLDLQKPIVLSVVRSGATQKSENVKVDSVQVSVPESK